MAAQGFSEDALVEQPAIQELQWLGWEHANLMMEFGTPTNPLASSEGRTSKHDVILPDRLWAALQKLNPNLPEEALKEAAQEFARDRTSMVEAEASRAVYDLLKSGHKVRFQGKDGKTTWDTVRFIDWRNPENNAFYVGSQVWYASDLYERRADLVGFVNGIPLVLFELKKPSVRVKNAYDENLRDYLANLKSLFHHNGLVVLSNGSDTRIGSAYAPWEHFFEWKKINSEGEEGVVSLETALRGICQPERLLDILENFILYTTAEGTLTKIVAKNHQYLGVNQALDSVDRIQENKGRLGVFWHTQGSGKSFSMVFFTQKILRTLPGNWTFLIVTDRDELDEQIYKTFSRAGAVTAPEQTCHAHSGAHLKDLLTGDQRYVFTLIQKFRTDKGAAFPKLSDRSDIIVITDEAHRSQYDTFAKNMRDALPNASFIGFTGTPLIAGEELTREVFGDYVSIYNFGQAIADGATVPLYYENRTPELQLTNENLNEEIYEAIDRADLDEEQEKKLERTLGQQYHLITRPERLDSVASDIVEHFVSRGHRGKAMVIAIDKATAVRMYDKVQAFWKQRIADLEAERTNASAERQSDIDAELAYMRDTDMAVVVSQAQNEEADMKAKGLDIRPHRKRIRDEDLEEKFKDKADPLRIVFVCAMWITGFDAPCVSTIYLDKPMRNHTLMQTIARANRVARGKAAGIIVDYIGVLNNLRKALAIYAKPSEGGGTVDEPIQDKAELVELLKKAMDELRSWCAERKVDVHAIHQASGFERTRLLEDATEILLESEEVKKTYLARASQIARIYKAILPDSCANDLGPTVHAFSFLAEMLRKNDKPVDITAVMDEIEEILDRSISTRSYIIRKRPEEEQFDLSKIDFDKLRTNFKKSKKRIELEKLRIQIEQTIQRMAQINRTRIDFLERLMKAIEAYNEGSRNVEETYEELVRLAEALSEEEKRHLREGLSEEELAIFDILTRPDPELTDKERSQVKQIAQQLLASLKKGKLVLDWRKKERARASVRSEISRLLDDLPEAYSDEIWERKCEGTYRHVFDTYRGGEFNNGMGA